MLALRRPKLIPLIATIAVMAFFTTAVLVGRPSPPSRVVAPDLMMREAPAAVLAPEAVEAATNSPPMPREMAPPSDASPAEAPIVAVNDIKPVEVSLPKLTYSYALGFRLEGGKIAEAQETHRALCEHMGPARCQLLAMQRGEADDAQTRASLKLRVASREAGAFTDSLVKTVARAGGRAIQTSVSTEDVSKDIVDAVARIRQREMLVTRLTDILRSRRGTVSELVEAERSVAAAQEELDQTRGWLTELRGRVAMADVAVTYQAIAPQASPDKAGNQLSEATLGSGAAFLIAIRSVLTLLIYLLPWMLLMAPLFYGIRWFARRLKADASAGTLPTDG